MICIKTSNDNLDILFIKLFWNIFLLENGDHNLNISD